MLLFSTHVCSFLRSALGSVLADTLVSFSIDLVELCASYVVCGAAKRDSHPAFLGSFACPGAGRLNPALALYARPVDGTLWLAAGGRVHVFSPEGEALSQFPIGFACVGMAFLDDEVLLALQTADLIVAHSASGKHVSLRTFPTVRGLLGMTMDSKGIVYALTSEGTVVSFDRFGKKLGSWSLHVLYALARGIATTPDDRLVVCFSDCFRVSLNVVCVAI